jgi:hypothetical protein
MAMTAGRRSIAESDCRIRHCRAVTYACSGIATAGCNAPSELLSIVMFSL